MFSVQGDPPSAPRKPEHPGAETTRSMAQPVVRMVFGLDGGEQDPEGVRTLLQHRIRQMASMTALARLVNSNVVFSRRTSCPRERKGAARRNITLLPTRSCS